MGMQLSPASRVRERGKTIRAPEHYTEAHDCVHPSEVLCYMWRDDGVLTASSIESAGDFARYYRRAKRGGVIDVYALPREDLRNFSVQLDSEVELSPLGMNLLILGLAGFVGFISVGMMTVLFLYLTDTLP